MRGFIYLTLYTLVGLTAVAPRPQGYKYASGEVFTHSPHTHFGVTPSHAGDLSNDLLGTNYELSSQLPTSFSLVNAGVIQAPLSYLTHDASVVSALQQQRYVEQQQQQQQQHHHIHQLPFSIQQQEQHFIEQPSQHLQLLQEQQQHISEQEQLQQQQQNHQHLSQQQQHHHHQQHHHSQNDHHKPIISKRFYLHSAPADEADTEVQQHHLTIGKPHKNYNIVFIKSAADKARSKATVKITPAVNEEKTVIYVLNKKHEPTDIEAEVHEPITTTAKPEVYFIKYKTPEEAAHAQHTIKAQYDALGGATQIINEGVGQESSVIGSLGDDKHAATEVAAMPEEVPKSIATADASGDAGAGAGTGGEEVGEGVYENHLLTQHDAVQMDEQLLMEQLHDVSSTNNGYLPPHRYYHRH